MGVYMCSTGKHVLFISVSPMQAFTCECPKAEPKSFVWSNVTPRVNDPMPGYDFIPRKRKPKHDRLQSRGEK